MPVSKLTPATTKKLAQYLERGHTIEGATGLVGIHRDTYFGWMEKGAAARALRDQGKPVPAAELPYLNFRERMELARHAGEGWLVEQLLQAADPGSSDQRLKRWQAYMTLLERTRPDRFRRRAAAEYSGEKASTPVDFTFDPQKLSNDELDSLQVLLEKARPDHT